MREGVGKGIRTFAIWLAVAIIGGKDTLAGIITAFFAMFATMAIWIG